jgi:hypothetical protein
MSAFGWLYFPPFVDPSVSYRPPRLCRRQVSFLSNRNLVFVVDDDAAVLRAVKHLLRRHGYNSVLFPSGEALENHSDFEGAICIILDINLTDGSGIELRYRLKAAGFLCRSSTRLGATNLPFAWLRFNPDASHISKSRSQRSR